MTLLDDLCITPRPFVAGEPPVMSCNIITRVSDSAYDTVKVFETNVKPLAGAPVASHFTF